MFQADLRDELPLQDGMLSFGEEDNYTIYLRRIRVPTEKAATNQTDQCKSPCVPLGLSSAFLVAYSSGRLLACPMTPRAIFYDMLDLDPRPPPPSPSLFEQKLNLGPVNPCIY
jgi:hypothetical protein